MKKLPLIILLFFVPKICLGNNSGKGLEFSFSMSGGSFTPEQGSPSQSTSMGMGEFGFAYTFDSGLLIGGSLQGIAFSTLDKEYNSTEWEGDGLSLYLGQKWKRLNLAGGVLTSSLMRRDLYFNEYYYTPTYSSANGSFVYLGYTLFRERSFDVDLYAKSLHLSLSNLDQYDSPRNWRSQQIGIAIRMYPYNWNYGYSNHSHRTHYHYHHYHGSGDIFFGLLRVLAYSGKHIASLVLR